ncbi:TRAP transporter large permease [Hydrogenimonas urashimensis]|uniref:TRAP transporter large permease n=1 Tax=Hydrogenimonas urashimensis TaxID=2740515 RepID=UPI0019151EEF|nr:TRAP transporter large permease subunit [Hydrogenimonas urashimensis]
MIGMLMFLTALVFLLLGIPVAFAFGGVAILFALLFPWDVGLQVFELLPFRIYGIMQNFTLMAVPLFIFMGLVLEKSKMAEDLLESMGKLFGPVRGGLAISTVLVGAILAASTGIVGASVVMMGLITLPIMLKHRYDPKLASGAIVASGTLGQLIPPSVVLIVLGDVMYVSVGDLFKAAVMPGVILTSLYILYILILSWLKPDIAPAMEREPIPYARLLLRAGMAILPPLVLIVAVLGSIFAGIASPTESAAVGVVGAVILTILKRSFHFEILRYAAIETVKLSAMIFMILIGATAFSLVFNAFDGGDFVHRFFTEELGSRWTFILVTMAVIFVLGFFVDFIEISFIVVPILVPIAATFGIDPIWFAILIAMNLQASFLTPPFGFALFYLKGAAGDKVTTGQIYRGVVPFILLQMTALAIVMFWPKIIYWLG